MTLEDLRGQLAGSWHHQLPIHTRDESLGCGLVPAHAWDSRSSAGCGFFPWENGAQERGLMKPRAAFVESLRLARCSDNQADPNFSPVGETCGHLLAAGL